MNRKRFHWILTGSTFFASLIVFVIFAFIAEYFVYQDTVKQVVKDNRKIGEAVTQLLKYQYKNINEADSLTLVEDFQHLCDSFKLPNDGFVCFVHNNGDLVAFPDLAPNSNVNLIENGAEFTDLKRSEVNSFQNLQQGFVGYFGFQDKGILDVCVSTPITSKYHISVHQNNNKLEKSAHRHFITLLFLGIIGSLVFGSIVYGISNQVVQSYEAELEQKNQHLNNANEEIQTVNESLKESLASVEKAYENTLLVGRIGIQVSSSLHLQEIIDEIYENLRKLMPIDVFIIGIQNEEENVMEVVGAKDKKGNSPLYTDSLDDEHLTGIWAFKRQEKICWNDYQTEYKQFVSPHTKTPQFTEKTPQSVMYIPLSSKDKTFGVMAVHSYQKNAYTEYQFNIFQNIGIYVSSALENAHIYQELQNQKNEIEKEREKSEDLLLNILPKATMEELKEAGRVKSKAYDKVSVLFTDFKDFTKIAEKMSEEDIVANLDHCFKNFDRIVKKHNLEKIKTIGDAYMCAGGIPTANESNPRDAICAAQEMMAFMKQWAIEQKAKNEEIWQLRMGIHTGKVVTGIVGEDKFAYDIWGDAVNTASRMESCGEANKINISGETYDLIKEEFNCEYRGKITAKNKGDVDMYFVNHKYNS